MVMIFFRTRSDPKIRPNFILLTFLLLYSVQYRIFVCRSSKYHYLDHLAQRAKNLVKKWPNSQKRKSGQRGNSFFSCYTAPPTQEFNILSRKSVIHTNIFFLDTNIESSNISHLEIKKMYIPLISSTSNDTDSILPGSSANISDAKFLTNIDLSGSISNSKASEIEAFDLKYNFEIAPYLAKYCSESNLDSSNKKRKDNPNTPTATKSPPDLGIGAIWNIIHCIADFHELRDTGIPPWYRTIQLGKLATLQHRSVALASRKTELEQRYHLLAASNESVVARPSSW